MEVSLTQMEFKNIFNEAIRWAEDRYLDMAYQSVNWAIKRPVYISIVKNTIKNQACMVYYQWRIVIRNQAIAALCEAKGNGREI